MGKAMQQKSFIKSGGQFAGNKFTNTNRWWLDIPIGQSTKSRNWPSQDKSVSQITKRKSYWTNKTGTTMYKKKKVGYAHDTLNQDKF